MKKNFFWVVLFSICILALGCSGANNSKSSQHGYISGKEKLVKPSKFEIENMILKELEGFGETELTSAERTNFKKETYAGLDHFPITINEQVELYIEYYQTKMPQRFTRYLNRSGKYYEVMRSILKDYGLPEDLFYLALIESGFTNTAISHAGAVGPWQFMPGTGQRFGLKIDNWVDERRDPIKSTHAAAQYLKTLYAEFGSWYLAAAGYNAGEAKIRKALTMYEADNYWSISQEHQKYLAEETKQYVPRMIAAAIIAKNPEKYGFTEVSYEDPLDYEIMFIHPLASLSALAKAASLDPGVLFYLNPELKRGAAPPGEMYELKIPTGAKAQLTTAYASLTPEQRSVRLIEPDFVRPGGIIKARKGDTLNAIAKRQGCTVKQLIALNPKIKSGKSLKYGQTIKVPGKNQRAYASNTSTKKDTKAQTANNQKSHSVSANNKSGNIRTITHKVQKGETQFSLARTYGLKQTEITSQLGNKKLIAGQNITLKIPANKAEASLASSNTSKRSKHEAVKYYTVQKGDTLWGVSSKFNVSVNSIKKLNNLRSNNLNVGAKLLIKR